MKKRCCILFLILVTSTARTQGFTYTVNYTNYTAQAQQAFDYSLEIWSYLLYSPVPVKVNTYYFVYPGGPLAITFSNGRKDFSGAIMDSTWYPTTLANRLTGAEINIGEYDMDIYVNGYYNFYFGTDGNPGPSQYDFPSVISHELGHGFGFTSLAKKDSVGVGSFGLLEPGDFSPAVTSFPWPSQDTMPSVFDRFIENLGGARLDTFSNPSVSLAGQFTSNQLYFNGPLTLSANSGNRARLFAPSVFELGTSVLHLNEGTYPYGNPDELMTPYINAGQAEHVPGPISLAMLQDMGWTLHTSVPEIIKNKPVVQLFPNPVSDVMTVSANFSMDEGIIISIYSADGREVIPGILTYSGKTISLQSLPKGYYAARIEYKSTIQHFPFIKN